MHNPSNASSNPVINMDMAHCTARWALSVALGVMGGLNKSKMLKAGGVK